MANPVSPVDGSGLRIGFITHKVGSTLSAILYRALTRAATSGANDVGHAAFATHVEDDPAAYADASSATPLALIGGKRGSHVTVSAGDVSAVQVDTKGALMVSPAAASFITGVATIGTGEANRVLNAATKRLRIYNNHVSNTLYYREVTGVTTSNGYPIPPGAQEEIDIQGGVTIYLIASGAGTDVRFREDLS